MKTKYSVYFQICLGLICGVLNIVLSRIMLSICPFYMDNFFTVVATLFSGLSGFIAATLFHILNIPFLSHNVSSFAFVICSYTTVTLFYFYTKDKDSLNLVDIIVLSLILTLLISLEGSFVFLITYKYFNFKEDTSAKFITYILIRQNVSLLISSFLARIPVNLIDKIFAVVFGYLLSQALKKVSFVKSCIVTSYASV